MEIKVALPSFSRSTKVNFLPPMRHTSSVYSPVQPTAGRHQSSAITPISSNDGAALLAIALALARTSTQ